MIITATSRNNGIETFPLQCECEVGKNLEEAVAIYGKTAVYDWYLSARKIAKQGNIRNSFSKVQKACNNDVEKIMEWFKCEDGCFIVDKAGYKNELEEHADKFANLSKEKQAQRIIELTAIYERNENE